MNGYEDKNFEELDYATDLRDIAHVNLRGSEKITDFIGTYLKSNFDIPDHSSDLQYKIWGENMQNIVNEKIVFILIQIIYLDKPQRSEKRKC